MSQNSMIADRLQRGETVRYRPHGNSMTPRVHSGELVIVAPCKIEDLEEGDIAFCKVNGRYFLHLVKAIGEDGRVLISNNHGHINGWTRTIFGKLIDVAH